MEPAEVSQRMRSMRSSLRRYNVFRWMLDILTAAGECEADSRGAAERQRGAADLPAYGNRDIRHLIESVY